MDAHEMLRLTLRHQKLERDSHGRNSWVIHNRHVTWSSAGVALLLCDVWDRHWSRGATERVDEMAPRIDEVVRVAREQGVTIIHAPSDTLDFYADHPARLRAMETPRVDPPEPSGDAPAEDLPLPVDASDHGSDTGETEPFKAWIRQHPAIEIDNDRDFISDDGHEVYSILRSRNIGRLLIAGVHTNMCVLGRSFAIKAMVRRGIETALVRDLTDAMYNPARPPYVSHEEGTWLVIEYIEKFWCPTLSSLDILESQS